MKNPAFITLSSLIQCFCFLDRRQSGPIKSMLLLIIWLVTQFSQKPPKGFF